MIHRQERRSAGRRVLLPIAVLLALCVLPDGLSARSDPAAPRCRPTPEDVEGPFYRPGAPERTATGSGLAVSGRILGAPDCRPLPDGRIEWWHADPSGEYNEAHRGSQGAGPDGTYRFTTDFPGQYPGRPPHIHFKVFAPGYRTLTTQFYLRGRPEDAVFTIVLAPAE
jgi:protocatechuate 3,4-dioxygenase beta subunit